MIHLDSKEDTMPAFTFEKISAPKRSMPNKPKPVIARRNVIASLIDRVAKTRQQQTSHRTLRFDTRRDDDQSGAD